MATPKGKTADGFETQFGTNHLGHFVLVNRMAGLFRKGSRLVNLHFRAYDPQVATDAVNMLAQLYIEQSLELRFTTSTEATGWLSDRLKEQQAKVEAAEKALQDYR